MIWYVSDVNIGPLTFPIGGLVTSCAATSGRKKTAMLCYIGFAMRTKGEVSFFDRDPTIRKGRQRRVPGEVAVVACEFLMILVQGV